MSIRNLYSLSWILTFTNKPSQFALSGGGLGNVVSSECVLVCSCCWAGFTVCLAAPWPSWAAQFRLTDVFACVPCVVFLVGGLVLVVAGQIVF